jgi:hypothetical protein
MWIISHSFQGEDQDLQVSLGSGAQPQSRKAAPHGAEKNFKINILKQAAIFKFLIWDRQYWKGPAWKVEDSFFSTM